MASGPLSSLGMVDGPLLRRSVLDDVTGNPLITSAPTGEIRQRSALLPLGRDDNGALAFAVPQGVFDAIDAARSPQQALSGELQVFDPATGHVSDQAMNAANGLAGLAMTGSLPFEAPAGALRMFGGRNAATADLTALGQAEKLASAGADRRAIWDQTGWFKGADDKWRFEIPDDASKIGTGAADKFLDGAPLQGKVAGNFWHRDLYAAYPDLRRLDVNVERAGDYTAPYVGSYNGRAITGQAASTGNARELMLHELQHGIQDAEGFALGGDPNNLVGVPQERRWQAAREAYEAHNSNEDADLLRELGFSDLANRVSASTQAPWDQLSKRQKVEWLEAGRSRAYHQLAGEVEARNVERRRDFTPDQRRATPPWETQDVPDAQQIMRFGTGDPQMSVASANAKDIGALQRVLEADHPNINQYVSQAPGGPVVVNKVVVPPEARGQGAGTRFMRDVLDYADANGAPTALTPSADFGGKLGALRDWYGSLGFVPNKGRARDFSISETMIRQPQPLSFLGR